LTRGKTQDMVPWQRFIQMEKGVLKWDIKEFTGTPRDWNLGENWVIKNYRNQ